MKSARNRTRRLAALVLFAGVLGSAAYAFTASNTVPGSAAGSGAGAISGYTASAVSYSLNATNPGNIDQVAFTLNPTAAGTVKIKLAAAGVWYACANAAGSVTCNTTVGTQATVAAASELTVLAVE
jgi:hypothetical protein